MQENVRLLMEETNCEQGEAELALELTSNDLEKAIRKIESLLKYLFAIKGKFYFTDTNLYGLILAIIDTRTQEILRLSMVISYNPSLYEHPVDMDWYALEKLIFSYRLDEGTLPDLTKQIERKFSTFLLMEPNILKKYVDSDFSNFLQEFFAQENVVSKLNVEELNLAQFRNLPSINLTTNTRTSIAEGEPGSIFLEISILEDENGKDVKELTEGDSLLTRVIDSRDIAHYLTHLIGSQKESEMHPLPAVVKKVVTNDELTEIHVHYSPGIMGVAKVKNNMRVKISQAQNQSWWKKLIPWG